MFKKLLLKFHCYLCGKTDCKVKTCQGCKRMICLDCKDVVFIRKNKCFWCNRKK